MIADNRNMKFYIIIPIAIYILIFSVLSILKYRAYNMAMVDLGRMDQAAWNTINGRILMNTWENGNICRLAGHVEFIFLPVSLLYLFFPYPETLLVLQTVIIALGSLAVYKISLYILKSNFGGLCFMLAYLIYPGIQFPNLIDFHPDLLALSFLLFAFYYILKNNWLRYYIFLSLSLFCKEYVSLIAVMLGIYILFFAHNRKAGFSSIVLGIAWFILAYKIIPPYFNNGQQTSQIFHYKSLGNAPEEILKNILLHPVRAFINALTVGKIFNLILLMIPLGFLSVFSLPVLLIGFPVLAGLLLTDYFSYANHHNAVIIPFIFISAIKGADWLADKLNKSKAGSGFCRDPKYAVCSYVLSCSLLSAVTFGPSPLSWNFWNKNSYRYWGNLHQFKITEHDRIADKIIKLIPAQASVSASNHLASHLSHRETIYQFPYPGAFDNIDFVLVDILEYFPVEWNPRQAEREALKKLLQDDKFSLRACEDGILLLERNSGKKTGYYMNIAIVKDARPRHMLNLSFDNRILLIGYDFERMYREPGTEKSYRIIYYWRVLGDFNKKFLYKYFASAEDLDREYILVDTFRGTGGALRLVHLPAYILHAPQEWREGEILKEEYNFSLPSGFPEGTYKWKIGLYAAPQFFFIRTRAEGLVPGTEEAELPGIKFD